MPIPRHVQSESAIDWARYRIERRLEGDAGAARVPHVASSIALMRTAMIGVMSAERRTVDLRGYPDLIVIDLGIAG
jgi:hypothetical protein